MSGGIRPHRAPRDGAEAEALHAAQLSAPMLTREQAIAAGLLPDVDPAAVAGARALEELLELHSGSQITELCRECLTPHPCRTVVLARIIAGETPAPDIAPETAP